MSFRDENPQGSAVSVVALRTHQIQNPAETMQVFHTFAPLPKGHGPVNLIGFIELKVQLTGSIGPSYPLDQPQSRL